MKTKETNESLAEDYDAVKEAVRKSLYDFVANDLTEEGLMMYRIACRTDI